MTIQELINKYKSEVDYLDLELLIAHSLGQTREFVLMHPEHEIPSINIKNFKLKISRRMRNEPIAYIVGHKEFYGLDFIVNKHTLIPRPETELIVEQINESRIKNQESCIIADIGTGSGCIIVSIANELHRNDNVKYYATDISKEALKVAKKNAKHHGLDNKIKFLYGSLLEPLIKTLETKKLKPKKLIITANLPYLSKEIYSSTADNVKKYEPKSALYSPEAGLQHYRKLLQQLLIISRSYKLEAISCFMEISPEQKIPITKLIKSIFPKAKIAFTKDLAGKWRVCKISISLEANQEFV